MVEVVCGYLSELVSEGKMESGNSGKQSSSVNTKSYKPTNFSCEVDQSLIDNAGNADNNGLVILSYAGGCGALHQHQHQHQVSLHHRH